MRSQLVIRAAAFAVALLAGTTSTRADEREDRDRKARAALALSAPAPKLAAGAPKPREVGAEYATAYARAVEQSRPMVVYVACTRDHKAPGAVAAKADALPGVTGPAAVVMYPRGDGLLVHRVMQCPVDDAELSRAIKDAAKKADGAAGKNADKAAPKPLDWQIRHEVPRDTRTELDVLRDASVRVWCGDAGGSGTVVFAEPGRSVILTAAHVVDHGAPVTVRADGRTLPARVLLTDRAADVVALEVRRELSAVVSVSDEWDTGDEVLMVGGSSIWSKGKARGAQQLNDRPNLLADYESISGDSGGGVFVRGSLVAVHVGRIGDRARCPCRLTAFVAKAIRAEPVATAPKASPVASAPDCPNGNCNLKPATYAAPVMLPASGCAGGNCPAPSYQPVRGGLFRRW